jgi:hypothetical protein
MKEKIQITYKKSEIMFKEKPVNCCYCLPVKIGLAFIILIQIADLINLIIFSFAVMPLASFQTQQELITELEMFDLFTKSNQVSNQFGDPGV